MSSSFFKRFPATAYQKNERTCISPCEVHVLSCMFVYRETYPLSRVVLKQQATAFEGTFHDELAFFDNRLIPGRDTDVVFFIYALQDNRLGDHE